MTQSGDRILVTGGTGFVGGHLIPDLRAAGLNVIHPTRTETGDIDGGTDWRPFLEDVDTVIHLANRAHVMTETEQNPIDIYRKINLDGTRQLARQAAEAGCRRFIFVSSVKTMGEASARAITAKDVPAPCDPYGISKAEAETSVLQFADRLEIVILRPPLVYGPGVKGNFIALLKLLKRGIPLPLGAIPNKRSMIYVKNLTHAIIHSLNCPPGTYLPSDQDDLSTTELFRRAAQAQGQSVCLIPIPVFCLKIAGLLTGKSSMIQRLTGSLTVDGHLPGWTPPYSVEQGLKSTADWYQSRMQDIS